ncbi:unnamed protein product [Closterium sp. NIES-54]
MQFIILLFPLSLAEMREGSRDVLATVGGGLVVVTRRVFDGGAEVREGKIANERRQVCLPTPQNRTLPATPSPSMIRAPKSLTSPPPSLLVCCKRSRERENEVGGALPCPARHRAALPSEPPCRSAPHASASPCLARQRVACPACQRVALPRTPARHLAPHAGVSPCPACQRVALPRTPALRPAPHTSASPAPHANASPCLARQRVALPHTPARRPPRTPTRRPAPHAGTSPCPARQGATLPRCQTRLARPCPTLPALLARPGPASAHYRCSCSRPRCYSLRLPSLLPPMHAATVAAATTDCRCRSWPFSQSKW